MRAVGARGTMRCPNWPASMRLPQTVPTSLCKKGTPCPCGQTVAIPADVMGKIVQWPLWGTSDHHKRYGKRGAVEVSNSLLYKAGHARGYVRVFTQPKNAFLLSFLHVSINIHQARIWRILHELPSLDGPELATEEDDAPPPADPPRLAVPRRSGAPPGDPLAA
ncbi:MAG: hypothetical protein JWN77_2009 [Frankiales bacterium]|nr:hypothetical protein [Frankiales bacterium]